MRQQAPESARVEPAPARREEERVLGAARELRARLAEVDGDRMRGLLAERHHALLAALAAHVNELLVEVDVGQVEVDRLLRAEARRIDELDERAVAPPERILAVEGVELTVHLVRLRRV